jgi:hypothetical protein
MEEDFLYLSVIGPMVSQLSEGEDTSTILSKVQILVRMAPN